MINCGVICTFGITCYLSSICLRDRHGRGCGHGRGRDHMKVGFTTTCAIIAYHHLSCEFEPHSWRGVLDTTLYDKVCQ